MNLSNKSNNNSVASTVMTDASALNIESSKAQIYTKAYTLCLSTIKKEEGRVKAENTPQWSKEELRILKKWYPTDGYEKCQAEGVKKTMYAITSQATLLGIKRKVKDCGDTSQDSEKDNRKGYSVKWTEKEERIIEEFFPLKGYSLCAQNGITKTEEEVLVKVNKDMNDRRIEFIKKGFITPSRWTREQIKILLKYYPEGGTSLCQEMGLNKKNSSIRMMAKSLKIAFNKEKPWSGEECSQLKHVFNTFGTVESCYEAFPKRTKTDIKSKMKELNLSIKKRWTENEENMIRKYYPQGGARLVIENGVNRGVREIGAKASNMGIKIINSRSYWSKEEEEILKEFYPIEGIQVWSRLKDKDKSCIRNKVRHMKLMGPTSKWTDEETAILKKYYPIEGGKVSQRLPGKTPLNVYYKASLLKLAKKNAIDDVDVLE